MASSKNGTALTRGSVAGVTFYEKQGQTIARAAHNNRTQKGRTPANLTSRTKMANLINNWRVLKPFLKDCFEDRKPLASEYNGFTSNNLASTQVHLTLEQSKGEAAVADHFCVSHGTLPQPVQTVVEGGRIRSDIKVGTLAKGADCTLYEFAVALLAANPGRLEWGDEVRYVVLRQTIDIDTGMPTTQAAMSRILLTRMDPRPLRAVIEGQFFQEGFSFEEGSLSAPYRQGTLSAWIILRPQKKGRPRVTPQTLAGENPLLEQYTSEEQLREAIESYGPQEG